MRGVTFIVLVLFYLGVAAFKGKCENYEENYFSSKKCGEKKRLIVDTDAGVDDGVAILNLLSSEELLQNVGIQMITTVFGNTNVDNVARNVLKILDAMSRLNISVYKGSNQSLVITPKIDDYFGEDGFGDFNYSNPPSEDLIMTKHAVQALVEEVNLEPGELTLVCLGPLTNIALAIKLDSAFLKKLKEVYILGGSDSGVGNVKPGVEFNFYVDPEAAFIVLKEAEKNNITLNLLTWETALIRSTIDMSWRKYVLGIIKSPQVNLINNMERLTLNGEDWISADTILSSVVIDNDIIENSDSYHAVVETCGEHSRASLFTDFNHLINSTKNIRIIKKINTEYYKKMLLQNFNSRGGSKNRA